MRQSDPADFVPFDGGLSLPIARSTSFAAPSALEHRERFRRGDPRFYQRFCHPTAESAAHAVARLENAEAGLVFSSGMGAISTTLIAMLRSGDHVVAHTDIFAQTKTLLVEVLTNYGVQVTFVDARDPGAVERALMPSTRMVYIETPSNPLLHVIDIAALAQRIRPRGIELAVDSTFASPALQQPIPLGATISIHSGTKFLGGHSDVMCGVICGSRAVIERIRPMQILLGTVLDPQAAWLLHRGTLTLKLRVERQASSALRIASTLASDKRVMQVRYPRLPSGESFEVAHRQMSGGGGVVSFELRGGLAQARAFVDALKLIRTATSLGGVETVIELPYDLDFDGDEKRSDDSRDNIPGLLRLSVGLEDPEELMRDLEAGLSRVAEHSEATVST